MSCPNFIFSVKLCGLCASVVDRLLAKAHHRDTEDTEDAQRTQVTLPTLKAPKLIQAQVLPSRTTNNFPLK